MFTSRLLVDSGVDLLGLAQQGFELVEGHYGSFIALGFRGVGMRLDEKTVAACCNGRFCERGDKFALASRGVSKAAR